MFKLKKNNEKRAITPRPSSLAKGYDSGPPSGSGIFAYISSITCAPCKASSDWIRVLVAVTNEILKRESSKCILDLPRVERRDPNRNPWLAKKGSNENIFPVCQSFETVNWLTVSASKLNCSQISYSSLGAAIFNSPTYV
jgi:hypothetical protein